MQCDALPCNNHCVVCWRGELPADRSANKAGAPWKLLENKGTAETDEVKWEAVLQPLHNAQSTSLCLHSPPRTAASAAPN